MSNDRETKESPLVHGPDEAIAYGITTTPWGSSPTNVSVVVWDITSPHNPTDVTGTTTTGAASVASDVITTPKISSLTLDNTYRVDVKFDASDGNTYEPYFILVCR
jgi:hypothetical protein